MSPTIEFSDTQVDESAAASGTPIRQSFRRPMVVASSIPAAIAAPEGQGTPGPDLHHGRYRLGEHRKLGSLGEIRHAVEVGLHGFERPVCLKYLEPAIAEEAARRAEEVARAAQVSHGRIQTAYDLRAIEGGDLLVLARAPGSSLSALVTHAQASGVRLPVTLAYRVVMELADALDYLRGQEPGVRAPINPRDVFLSRDGELTLLNPNIVRLQEGRSAHRGGGDSADLESLLRLLAGLLRRADGISPSTSVAQLLEALDRSSPAALHRSLGRQLFRGRCLWHPEEMGLFVRRVLERSKTRRARTKDAGARSHMRLRAVDQDSDRNRKLLSER